MLTCFLKISVSSGATDATSQLIFTSQRTHDCSEQSSSLCLSADHVGVLLLFTPYISQPPSARPGKDQFWKPQPTQVDGKNFLLKMTIQSRSHSHSISC